MDSGVDRSGHYRAHLDGLRAVAVYLVLLFHAGADRFSGGFIGVDVFFVLSGYLVTQLIVRDRDAERFRASTFYSRRVRRLLPAALVNLTVTAVVFAALASPADLRDAGRAITSAALYVSNWFFISQSTDYFAADIEASPVLQYWSLSVEEQFYLVWPLAMVGLFALTRRAGDRQRGSVRLLVIGAGVASLVAALLIARTDPTRAYMGSDTRAYQLLAGAALAMSPGAATALRDRARLVPVLPWLSLALLGALVGLATSVVDVGPVTRGAAVTAVTVLLLVTLEAATGGPARALLSRPSIVYLGKISYGTYLWHWLVIYVIADAYAPSSLVMAVVAIPVATAIASLSYHLLELPIRTNARLDHLVAPVVVSGVAMSLLVGLLVAPQILDRASEADTTALAGASTDGTPNTVDWQSVRDENADALLESYACTDPDFSAPCEYVEGDGGPTVAVVGDSHALVLAPMLVDLAERHDASLWRVVNAGCPWTRGVRYDIVSPGCFEWQASVFDEIIPEIDPDIVVLVHRPVDDPTNGETLIDEDEGSLDGRPDLQQELLEQRVQAVIDGLRADGRKVVVVEPVPVAPEGTDPFDCISTAELLETCRFVVPADPTPQERIFRDIAAADPEVWSLSMDQLVCPYLPICDPVVGGVVVRSDDDHLTAAFGRTLVDPVDQFMIDNGILE